MPELEEDWVEYLRAKGVDAEVVKPSPSDSGFWTTTRQPKRAIRLTGKNIDEVRLAPKGAFGFREECYIHFRILLDRPLAKEAKKAVTAKSKPIRQNRFLGISEGKTTDIKWVGSRIAHSLNQDTETQMMLLSPEFGDPFREIKIKPRKIKPKGTWAVDIEIKPEFTPGPFSIEVYDRIGRHIREVVGTY